MRSDLSTMLKAVLAPTETERSARYKARMMEKLAALATDDERAAFLDGERRKWITRYEEFIYRIDHGCMTWRAGDPTAHDYIFTLADIDKVSTKYPKVQ